MLPWDSPFQYVLVRQDLGWRHHAQRSASCTVRGNRSHRYICHCDESTEGQVDLRMRTLISLRMILLAVVSGIAVAVAARVVTRSSPTVIFTLVGALIGVIGTFWVEHAATRFGTKEKDFKSRSREYDEIAERISSAGPEDQMSALSALETLAQRDPDKRQQAIDNLCAFLRTPVQSPSGELKARRRVQSVLTSHLRNISGTDDQGEYWPEMNIDLHGATLIDFDFDYCRVVHSSFERASFIGDASFAKASLGKYALFSAADFNGKAIFSGATFERAVFDGVRFRDEALFIAATSVNEIDFTETVFGAEARFSDMFVGGRASFDLALFNRSAQFNGCQFRGIIAFKGTLFRGRLIMSNMSFAYDSNFDSAQFSDDVFFDGSIFRGDVSFRGAIFRGRLSIRTVDGSG